MCVYTHLRIQMNFGYFEKVISDDHIILKMLPLFKKGVKVCGLPSNTLIYTLAKVAMFHP